jgi:ribosome-binding factor A
MKSQRQLQIGENVKRLMSEIFLRDGILTVPGSYITILEADVSPDAKNAKIYVDIFGNDALHEKIIEKLNAAAPHFRYLLAKKVALRVVPEITFVLDRTQAKALSLEELIKNEGERYKEPEPSAAKPKKAPVKKAAAKAPAKKKK